MLSLDNYAILMDKAIFIDRDGVLNTNRPDYVKSISEVAIYSSAFKAFRLLATMKLPVFIVTNQSCVGRGIVDYPMAELINQYIVKELADRSGLVARTMMCVHKPEDNCDCRKPKPAMFQYLMKKHNIRGGWMIGDGLEDVQVAEKVGLEPMLVLTGRGKEARNCATNVRKYANILEAVMAIKWSTKVSTALGSSTNAATAK